MEKLPPIEKIPEAYTAIVDNRVEIQENTAIVKSSDFTKEYTVKWKDNLIYSDDNSTYWQNYTGYPVIAVLMRLNRLSFNQEVADYFRNVNWNELNKKNKRDYKKSVEEILTGVEDSVKENIYLEFDKVLNEIKNLDIILTKKKSF